MTQPITIPRGFDFDFIYVIESSEGVAKDIAGYDAFVFDFDDARGAVDKLAVQGTSQQTGEGTDEVPFVNKGTVLFPITNDITAAWDGDVRIRGACRARVTGSSPAKWHTCKKHVVVVEDRIPDDLAVPTIA